VVLDERQVRDVRELDRGAEHPADRRHHAELDLPCTGDCDHLGEQTFVERGRCDDDAIDPVQGPGVTEDLFGAAALARGDHVDMDVREELELPASPVRERTISEDQRALWRSHPPPNRSRGDAEREDADRDEDPEPELT
jgi:hypothetical protein